MERGKKDSSENTKTIWTNSNVGEGMPGVMTPLTWSIVSGPLTYTAIKEGIKITGLKLPEGPLFGNICGRIYINFSLIATTMNQIPGLTPQIMSKIGGGPDCRDEYISAINIPRLCFVLKLPIVIPKLLRLLITLPEDSKGLGTHMKRRVEEFNSVDLSKQSSEGLLNTFYRVIEWAIEAGKLMISCTANSAITYGLLSTITKRWFNDEEGTLHNKLITGLLGLKSAQPAIEIWKLSLEAMRSYKIIDIILEKDEPEAMRDLETFEEGRRFLEKLRRFLDEYGHRAIGEMEFMRPRWREDPGFILRMLRSYILSGGESDPLGADPLRYERKQKEERIRITGILRGKLPVIKRIIFDKILKEAQQYTYLREYTKFYVVMCFGLIRRIILEMGRRLYEKGMIADSDDIFLLFYDEIIELLEDNFKESFLVSKIEERKKEYEYNLRLSPPPDVVIGDYNPKDRRKEEEFRGNILEGLGSSFGKVTGKARVLFSARESSQLKEGEILITPFTDAGWTPLFAIASAIVSDIGGPLSHSSVVAREYGIPSVVNVKRGTKVIKTGDIITVDGDAGRVYLEKSA